MAHINSKAEYHLIIYLIPDFSVSVKDSRPNEKKHENLQVKHKYPPSGTVK